MESMINRLVKSVCSLLLVMLLTGLASSLAIAAPTCNTAPGFDHIYVTGCRLHIPARGNSLNSGWNSNTSQEQTGQDILPTPTNVSAAALAAGNPERGKAIFIQQVPLTNDGPPCVGCHNIDSVGILGGGMLGPDLTGAIAKYGEAGLAPVLSNITFPTMGVVYAGKPLTADEVVDLVAFIKSASTQPQTNKEWVIIGLSIAGFLAVLVAAGFIWRGRLRGVRKQMVEKAHGKRN